MGFSLTDIWTEGRPPSGHGHPWPTEERCPRIVRGASPRRIASVPGMSMQRLMPSDPIRFLLIAVLIAVLSGAAVSASGGSPVADTVAVSAPGIDRWRGSEVDSDFNGDGYAVSRTGFSGGSELTCRR